MTKEQYIAQCLDDAIDALDVAGLPKEIAVGDDWIYPQIALRRLKNILAADRTFALLRWERNMRTNQLIEQTRV